MPHSGFPSLLPLFVSCAGGSPTVWWVWSGTRLDSVTQSWSSQLLWTVRRGGWRWELGERVCVCECVCCIMFSLAFLPSHSSPVTPHSSLLSLTTHPHTGTIVAQTTNGTLLHYSTTEGLLPWLLPSGTELKFPDQSCDYVTIANFKDKVCFLLFFVPLI